MKPETIFGALACYLTFTLAIQFKIFLPLVAVIFACMMIWAAPRLGRLASFTRAAAVALLISGQAFLLVAVYSAVAQKEAAASFRTQGL